MSIALIDFKCYEMDKTLKSLTALITIILGTNDYINVINDQGVKIPLNKYVLLHTIPECFELFSLENPDVCKLTFFYHHRCIYKYLNKSAFFMTYNIEVDVG